MAQIVKRLTDAGIAMLSTWLQASGMEHLHYSFGTYYLPHQYCCTAFVVLNKLLTMLERDESVTSATLLGALYNS